MAVTITLASPTVAGRSWSARIDPGGIATFRGLPSGTYHITSAPESGRAVSLDVAVRAGALIELETRFSSRGSTLVLTYDGRMSHGLTFADRLLTDLPESTNLWGLLDTVEPFVIVDRMDNGGLMTAPSGLVGSRGASWTTLTFSLDNVLVTGPNETGRVGFVPDLTAMNAVSVTTGMAPVDFGPPGAAIVFEPIRPGVEPEGAVSAGFTSGRMAGRNDSGGAPSIERLNSWSTINGQFGGPVGPQAGLFVAADATRSELQERAEGIQLPGDVNSVVGHFVTHPTSQDELRAIGSIQGVTAAFDGRDQFLNRDVTENDTFVIGEGTWEHVGDAGRRFLSLGLSQGALKPNVTASDAGGTVDRVFDGVMPDAPSDATSRTLTGIFELDPRDIQQGSVNHAFRVGAILEHDSESSSLLALPTVAETVNGLPARVWVTQPPATATSRRHVTEFTAYASDLIKLASRLTLEGGLRANLTGGAAVGAPTGVSWKTIAPRVSLRWAPDLVTLFAGYGRYYANLPLNWLVFGDPGTPTSKVYRWTDPNGDGRFEPSELGTLIALAGWGGSTGSIDPALRPPVTDEVTFGAERWLGQTVRLHAAATVRHERDLAGAVDVGVPLSSYTSFTVLDPGEDFLGTTGERPLTIYNRLPLSFGQDRYVLTNPAGDTARYEGFELTGEVHGTRLTSLVGAMAYLTRAGGANPGFTALENDQDVIGDRFIDPNAQPYQPGSVFFDRSYVLKWSTVYDAGHGVHASVTARYQDGQPFTRLVVAPTLNQGPEIVQAYRVGRTRFLYTLTIDAEIAKDFRIGRSTLQFTVDAFNLPNFANEVEENPVSEPTFRQTTAVQPPRTIRIGFRLRF